MFMQSVKRATNIEMTTASMMMTTRKPSKYSPGTLAGVFADTDAAAPVQ
jgi:hypothetical protein